MTFQDPAKTHTFGHPIAWLSDTVERRAQEFRRRKELKSLLDLDDARLLDLGVTRGEVETAMRLPLSSDAAADLHRISLGRGRTR